MAAGQPTDEAWRAAAENLARSIVFLQSRQVQSEASDASLLNAVTSAISRLDNEIASDVDSMGDSAPPAYLDTSGEVGLGELQRLAKLRTSLLGDSGLIAELKKRLDDPPSTPTKSGA